MVPVNWWTGKVKPNFEKLKGLGKTPDKPVYSEPRKCTMPTALHAYHAGCLALGFCSSAVRIEACACCGIFLCGGCGLLSVCTQAIDASVPVAR